ncbi:MAG: multiheme c-type cytochrome [Candidatus Rokuibacteriota bacterium]
MPNAVLTIALAIATSVGLSLALPTGVAAQPPISKEYKYTGTGSCAASNCHGAKRPPAKAGDPDDTYTTWAAKDKHNKAYATLSKKESAAIVQKMKLAKATDEPKCLGCHALRLSKDQLAPRAKYDISEGVSCDTCHGPAEKWLEGHDKGAKGGWPHEKSVSLGMYDTKDVLKRAELCVSCHLAIDADMVAAGHPTMIFELDTFSQNQPPHWKNVKEWFGPLAWSTGQAVALRESLQQLATRAKGNAPDALVQESLTQSRGHIIAVRPMAAQVAADSAKALDDVMGALGDGKDKGKVVAAAESGVKVANDLAKKLSQAKLNKDVVWTVLKGLVSDPQRATSAGLRSAEQVAMGVDSLYRAVADVAKPPEHKAIDAAITKMFDELPTKPADFKADKFTANVQGVAKNIK